MVQFPALLEQVAADYGVHRLTFFGLESAKLFHDYYESTKIIDLPDKEAEEKLYLVQRYIDFLQAYFAVLGIKPLAKM
jgi:arginyl-tRNA synthetase